MFLLVPAYPGCPGSKAVKQSLSLLSPTGQTRRRIFTLDGSNDADSRKDCLLYTSDAADDSLRVDLGGRRIIKKKFVIFHSFAQKSPWTDLHQIWYSRRGHQRNHLYKFLR